MQVNPDNSLSEWIIIMISLHEFTNNEWEMSISHKAAVGGCFVATQCHEVEINQSENRNSYSVWELNNKFM